MLVVIVHFSHWPEVIRVPKTDAQHIIKSMELTFQMHGLQESVRSDNGQPFASAEFGKSFIIKASLIGNKVMMKWRGPMGLF